MPSINAHKTVISGIETSIQSECRAAESFHILDTHCKIYSTGQSEHGNFGIGHGKEENVEEQCPRWKKISCVSVVAPPPYRANKLFASGGAHLIVTAA
jgi:alpha-tubulin suppressor-like RCC1 family protein